MQRHQKREEIEQQKQLAKWTKILAIGAFVAAGLTFCYVLITMGIFIRGCEDSEKEFRPYTVLSDFSLDTVQTNIVNEDSLVATLRLRYGFVNNGRTPALDFKLAYQYNNMKDTTHYYIDSIINSSRNSKTSSTIYGSVPQYTDKELNFILVRKDGSINRSYIQVDNKPAELEIVESRFVYFYFNCGFTYTEMRKQREYEGYYSMCIIYYFESSKFEVANDFSYIN